MFVILWHFEVKPGNQVSFEKAYSSDGPWAQLFRCDPHFRGTQLRHDPSRPLCYFTVDLWDSENAYRTFLSAHQRAYDGLDASLQHLACIERHVLSFELDPSLLEGH